MSIPQGVLKYLQKQFDSYNRNIFENWWKNGANISRIKTDIVI